MFFSFLLDSWLWLWPRKLEASPSFFVFTPNSQWSVMSIWLIISAREKTLFYRRGKKSTVNISNSERFQMKLKAILAHQRSTTAINRLRTLRINQLIHPSIIGQSIFISFLRFARAACPWRHWASGVRRPTNRKSIENVALTETDSLSSTNCRERAPADYSNLFNMNDGFQPSQTNGAGRFYEKGVNFFSISANLHSPDNDVAHIFIARVSNAVISTWISMWDIKSVGDGISDRKKIGEANKGP